MPLATCMATGAMAQWYTYRPGLRALNVNCVSLPGRVKVASAPPPWPVTACRSMLCDMCELWWFFSLNSTVSPSRTRMKLPGTVPPKVQKL